MASFGTTKKQSKPLKANQWLQEIAMQKRETTLPELDFYSRPYKWTIDMDTCLVIITREYINQNHSWAMKGEKFNCKKINKNKNGYKRI